MDRSRSSRGVRSCAWAFLAHRGTFWQDLRKKSETDESKNSESKNGESKNKTSQKIVMAGFAKLKKICSLNFLYISFPRAKGSLNKTARTDFDIIIKSQSCESKNVFVPKICIFWLILFFDSTFFDSARGWNHFLTICFSDLSRTLLWLSGMPKHTS